MIPLWWEKYHSVSTCLFSKMLPSHTVTCWVSCRELWRGQQFCLIRDGNHMKWDFTLDPKKSRKGQNFWRNTHAFVSFAPAKKGSIILHDFGLNLWVLFLKQIQGKCPAVVRLRSAVGGTRCWHLALGAVGTIRECSPCSPSWCESTKLLQYTWLLITYRLFALIFILRQYLDHMGTLRMWYL